ncbi:MULTISPECIES: FAD-dependent oxidoreductase [unclassified Caulobacter]|uniref:FAD-dependent oxidoreductase n=1 Tax=unclassified Caulobacter TaxID=2648921 RepID=UPI00130505BB|nr:MULTISPECIES: GMC family oxidoreductase [unclassified Caulobacter]
MILDGRDIGDGGVIATQVCIVGSGPAGITAALLLQKAGYKVVLIEGGRNPGYYQESWAEKNLLYAGQAEGLFTTNEPDFLIQPYAGQSARGWERERVYGGTSTHWGGQTRPLDPITFEARPGFPGWPITYEDLIPYYAQAAKLCVLHGDDFSADYWAGVLSAEVPDIAGFDTEMYQFMGGAYTNFATRTFDGVTAAEAIAEIIVNATLLEIQHAGGVVQGLRVASLDTSFPPAKATEFTITADVYVLACGAVENARQLLLSEAGNDQVGRYFQCHPLSGGSALSVSGNFISPAAMRLIKGQTPTGTWTDDNGVTVQGRFSPSADIQRQYGIGSCWFRPYTSSYYFEMRPNDESRITLADTVDPVFGQPQTRIRWEVGPGDQHTYETSTLLFQEAIGALGGQFYYPSWEDLKSQLIVNGHHIGTTRMSADPAKGAVDADLRVHGLDNLYVAGSSVFPQGGISNPTLTIVALSVRLAEHLGERLGRARPLRTAELEDA